MANEIRVLFVLIIAAMLPLAVPAIQQAAAHTPNHRPVIVAPEDGQSFIFEAGQGITASFTVSAGDSDGDFVNIVNSPLPAGAFYEFVEQFEGATDASITFEDGRPFVGTYSVTFTAVDEHGSQSEPVTVEIKVVAPDHLELKSAKLVANSQKVMLDVRAQDVRPTIERPAYGYAALTDDGNNILVVATHAGLLDSEDQDDAGDDILHTHVVDVVPSSDCFNGIKVAFVSFASPGNLIVGEDKIKVMGASAQDFGGFNGTVVSFILTFENGNVCVNPVDSATT